MWCYVDGQLLVETPVVTGCVQNGTETPRGGVWKVKGKRTDYTMRGAIDPDTGEPSYLQFVNYWIPYSEDLTIGLHDLTSRSAFGGDIYITNGSHGCVNTPLDAVRQIFEVVFLWLPCDCVLNGEMTVWKGRENMYDRLTESDIKKMQEEIDYRKLVVRPKELEAVKEARHRGISAKILSIRLPNRIRTATTAESVIWRK